MATKNEVPQVGDEVSWANEGGRSSGRVTDLQPKPMTVKSASGTKSQEGSQNNPAVAIVGDPDSVAIEGGNPVTKQASSLSRESGDN
ncbi:hypothetical protein WJX73_009163 [Symbiochloris irregularis]|uniref:Hypervirulence associated protein TUDOR domain-containing protein n=1 Tax=Symbiochloris irregularis TaxID=706552 RepID=A0AAW1NSS5_9CHLO